MAESQRYCPVCRKLVKKAEAAKFFYCRTCGWTDDSEDRKKLYGAKP